MRPYLEKLFTKIGLVEWFKVKALSSSPSPAKKKKKKIFPILLHKVTSGIGVKRNTVELNGGKIC
jgi:hypothetical protein